MSVIYHTIFQPVGIPRNKEFAQSPAEVERIVASNSGLRVSDFLVPAEYATHVASLGLTMCVGEEGCILLTRRHLPGLPHIQTPTPLAQQTRCRRFLDK